MKINKMQYLWRCVHTWWHTELRIIFPFLVIHFLFILWLKWIWLHFPPQCSVNLKKEKERGKKKKKNKLNTEYIFLMMPTLSCKRTWLLTVNCYFIYAGIQVALCAIWTGELTVCKLHVCDMQCLKIRLHWREHVKSTLSV